MISETIRILLLSGMLMVGAAGIYACLYALGRLLERPTIVRISYVFAVLEVAGGLGMIVPAYLDPFWKYLVAFASFAYLLIPPGMWWVVVTFHAYHEAEHGH